MSVLGPQGSPSAPPDWVETRTGGTGTYASGDFNGDGYMDLAVGAVSGALSSNQSGVVLFHYGSAQGLSTGVTHQFGGSQAGGFFGWSIASADVNADGFDDLVVGEPSYDGAAGADEGRVHLLLGRTQGAPLPAWISPAGGAQAGAHLGLAVARAGDVNGDGRDDVLIAAPYYDRAATNDGLVSLFLGTSSGLSNSAAWSVWGGAQNELAFGESLAGGADLDGDGLDDFVVGAPSYDASGAAQVGLVAVFRGNRTLVSTTPYRTVQGTTASGSFGRSVAFARAFDGNRTSLFVGSANMTSVGATDGRGTVSRYTNGASALAPQEVTTGQCASCELGVSLMGGADWNGDGREDVVAGQAGFQGGAGRVVALAYLGSTGALTVATGATGEALGGSVGFLRRGRKDTRTGIVASVATGSNLFLTAAPAQNTTTAGVRLIHNVALAAAYSVRFVMQTDSDGDGTYDRLAVNVIVPFTGSQAGAPFIPNVPAGVAARVTADVVEAQSPNNPVGLPPTIFVLPANMFAAGKNYRAMAAEDKSGTTSTGKLCQRVEILQTTVCLSLVEDLPVPLGKAAVEVSLGVWNGVPDAGALDFRFEGTQAPFAQNVNPGDIGTLLLVEPTLHRIAVTQRSSGTLLGVFTLDLTGQGGQVADVLAKGYLRPQENPSPFGGAVPAFGMTEVTATGSSVATGIPEAGDALGSSMLLGMFPNPARGTTTVSFSLASPASVRFDVFDVLGQRVLSVEEWSSGAGNAQQHVLDVSSLPGGVYLVRLTARSSTGRVTTVAPLTVVR